MGPELKEAKEQIPNLMSQLSAELPSLAFGVSRVQDVPDWNGTGYFNASSEAIPAPSESEFASNSEKAWKLDQPISVEQGASIAAIKNLKLGSGGDAP